MAAPVRRKGETEVLAALARGHSAAGAARSAGISDRTVRRWLDDPAFAGRVEELRRTMLDAAVGQLADAAADAVSTLRLMLAADSEAVRVRAARAILAAVVVLRESLDLEERLAVLERLAEEDYRP